MSETIETSQTFGRGLEVLQVVAAHPQGLTLSDVARRTGAARAVVRRLLHTLCDTGYARASGGHFLPTGRTAALSAPVMPDAAIWKHALPAMQSFSALAGEACSLAILAGDDVVYVARAEGRHVLSVHLSTGSRLPAAFTSLGRVLLADMDDRWLRPVLNRLPFDPPTHRAVSTRNGLLGVLQDVRRDGHAIVEEELEVGLLSAAVPVRLSSGACIAALNVSTLTSRLTAGQVRSGLIPSLRDAADRIGEALSPPGLVQTRTPEQETMR
ncbi:MAG: IclR family transcriptional regulator domain-containing protein [Shimia sp.]